MSPWGSAEGLIHEGWKADPWGSAERRVPGGWLRDWSLGVSRGWILAVGREQIPGAPSGCGRHDGSVTDSFVLVHAPVLGPRSWSAVASELGRQGHHVTVPSLTGFADAGPPYAERLIDRVRAQLIPAAPGRVALAVHSGAGVLAPYLAEAAGAHVVIFADASLPPAPRETSGEPAAQVIDAEYLPFLQGLARDGVVPPWPQWWPAEELAPLYPDDATRASVDAEAAALPLAFYTEHLPPIPASWATRRAAYLQFSEGYDATAEQARALGWPVRTLPGEHLHMLVAPAAVAAALSELARG